MFNHNSLSRIIPDIEFIVEDNQRLIALNCENKNIFKAFNHSIEFDDVTIYLEDFINLLSNGNSSSTIRQLKNLINTDDTGLLLTNDSQNNGLIIYLVRSYKSRLQFFNVILISNQISQLFTLKVWKCLKLSLQENQHNFYKKNTLLAFKKLANFFRISAGSFDSTKAYLQYEFGESLHYLTPSKSPITDSTGRNLISKLSIEKTTLNAKNISFLTENIIIENYFHIIK